LASQTQISWFYLNYIGKKKTGNNSKQENIDIKKLDKWGPKKIHYQLWFNGEIKKNKTFIKELRNEKEIIRIRIKLKTPIHDQINLNMLNFSMWFFT